MSDYAYNSADANYYLRGQGAAAGVDTNTPMGVVVLVLAILGGVWLLQWLMNEMAG